MRFLPLWSTVEAPSQPNLCVCERERESCEGGECTPTDKSPHRGAAQQRSGASQLGRGLPRLLGDGSNPRILMQHPFKVLWTLESAPHILCFCDPSSSSAALYISSSPTSSQLLGKLWPLSSPLHPKALESPTSPQKPGINYESSAGRTL